MLDTSLDGLLEIYVSRSSPAYRVELRFYDLASQGRTPPVSGPAPISPQELVKLQGKLEQYGETLSAAVFQDAGVNTLFQLAKARVEGRRGLLRITILIDPAAPELQALAWELLVDPQTKALFSTNEGTPLSRFLYGRDWTSFEPRRKGEWNALIAVPNPSNFSQMGIGEIHAEEEIQLAEDALKGAAVRVMKGPVTMDALVAEIEKGVDLVYLVCHGGMDVPDEEAGADDYERGFGEAEEVTRERDMKLPCLYLEDDKGAVQRVRAGLFARKLADLGNKPRPRLMVLASCESAGQKGDWTGQSAQASLAPRLAQAGVPALVAMQGKITMETAKAFMKPFFSALNENGRIDQAMAKARGAVRARTDDCWMPALFLRLEDGRLWYEPGFTEKAEISLESIAAAIVNKKVGVTPIIGWGLAESIYGTKHGLSERMGAGVPLEADRMREMPLVSQYLQHTSKSAIVDLKEQMRQVVLERFAARAGFPERLKGAAETASLSSVLKAAGELQRQNELDPYRIVASLDAKVFINASLDNLLIDALVEQGKTPIVRYLPWKPGKAGEAESLDPTYKEPLVLQVFGHFKDEESLILGEDEYFDFLIGLGQNQKLIPAAVKNAMTEPTLLFLGFNLGDWSFRVLFRLLKVLLAGAIFGQQGKPNVAVQVEPGGTFFSGPEEAIHYLKKYYSPSIEPFWGTSEDFLTELWPKVKVLMERRDEW